MASPSTSSVPAVPPKYEYLKSLSDIQTIRDLNEEAVRDILRSRTSDHGLEVVEMGAITDMSGLNDAFNSTICSLKVKVKFSGKGGNPKEDGENSHREQGNEQEFNFVIKSPPKMAFIKLVHKLSRPFFNEVSWYLDLVPQLELACGRGTLDHLLPICYHAYSSYYAANEGEGTFCTNRCPWYCWLGCKSAESGVLILENVKLRAGIGYQMYDKRKPLPLDHIQVVFKEIALFHGKWLKWISLARAGKLTKTDQAEPISFKTFQSTYNTQMRIPKILYKQLKNVAKKTVIKILKKCGPEEDENVRKCRSFFERTAMEMLSEYMTRPPSKIYTLCHGDFWSNNILFAYEEGKVRDLILIDFQLINYGHPAYDLVYFIYLNTDLAFRDAHLQTVLRTYFDHFEPFVRECLPSDFIYSFEDFVADFNFHRPLGFTTACSVMPNVLSDCQLDLETTGCLALRELQRKQEIELDDDANPSSIEIRRRIVEMVHEMARDGVI